MNLPGQKSLGRDEAETHGRARSLPNSNPIQLILSVVDFSHADGLSKSVYTL